MSTDPSPSHYRLDPHARFRVMDDEGVFVLQEAGEVLVVNQVGALIVQELAGGRSVDEAIDTVTQRYDVNADRARSDAAALLESLVAAGAMSPA